MQVTVETNRAILFFALVKDDWIQDGMEIRGGYKNEERERLPCLSFFGNAPAIELPSHGDWQFLGSPFSLAEEQWRSILDVGYCSQENGPDLETWKNYISGKQELIPIESSRATLFIANKIWQTNPYGEKCPEMSEQVQDLTVFPDFAEDLENWHNAQYRTGNWVVLVKYKNSQ